MMNANRRRKNNNTNTGGNSRRVASGARRRVRVRVPGQMDQKALAYRQLLADPCNGPLVPPTAIGPSSGLVVRQRKIQGVASGNNLSTGSFIVVCTPATGELRWTTDNATTMNAWNSVSLETGILDSNITRSYRCVAACMKWVPTGPLTARSGSVHSGFVLDKVDTDQVAAQTSAYVPMCPHSASNTGIGEPIEVRWVPTGPEDLEFRDGTAVYNAETGSMVLIGRAVDTAGTTVGAAFNGYIDITTVYEWLPKFNAGVVAPMVMGSTTPLQTVLASLGELGRFAVDSQYVRQVMGRMVGMAAQVGAAYVGQRAINSYAGPSLLGS